MRRDDSVTVDAAVRRRRLDRYLADRGEWGSRAQVQRLIAEGAVTLDGEVAEAAAVVRPGQVIRIRYDEQLDPDGTIEPEAMELVVLFEDNWLLVLDKPAGLVVHPAAGNWTGTLVAGLLHRWQGPREGLDPRRPGLVHRLDKDTSGVLLVAKDAATLADLAAQFEAREVAKEYLAIVWGRPREVAGRIDAPIGRNPAQRQQMAVRPEGRAAVTDYQVLGSNGVVSLVRLRPKTGRTHQIRVHLKSLGHPIVGDATYGPRTAPAPLPAMPRRQALHAAALTVRHPHTGERLRFEAPLPPDLRDLVDSLTSPTSPTSPTGRTGRTA